MGRFTVKKPMIKEKQTTVTGRGIEKLKESTSCGKRIWVRRTVMAAIFFILILAAYRLNTMKKTELVTRTGNTYEKGVVQKVLQDNLQADRDSEDDNRCAQRRGHSNDLCIWFPVWNSLYTWSPCHCCSVCLRRLDGILCLFQRPRRGDSALWSVVSCGFDCGWRPAGVEGFRSAVVICALTTILTFWCIGGISRKTITATLGTVSGVVIAGIFAEIFSLATGISGWNVSNIETLLTIWESNRIKVGGLLFAGILISALGAEMDVAMSISSSMQEVCRQNPGISRWELFCAGMRVGRDMMGTDSNTLLLAFVGTEVSQLVLNFAYDLPAAQVLNSNNIGIAVMQGLSGSFGIVLSVPITVLIASWIFRGKPSESTERVLQ